MRFLQESHESAHHLFFLSFRSVLYRCATLSLYKRIIRTNESNNGAFRVRLRDIDVAYMMAQRVGQKWMVKLQEAGEEEMAVLLNIAIEKGRYFESIGFGDVDKSSKTALFDFLDGDSDESQTSVNTGENMQGTMLANLNQNVKQTDIFKFLYAVNPFIAVSKTLDTERRITSMNSELGKSSEWYPLPGFNIASKNHIPVCSKLSDEKLENVGQQQIYGAPKKSLNEHKNLVPCHPIVGKDEFTKSRIDLLERLGQQNKSMWQFDWNIVQRASQRNYKRMHLANAASGRKRRKLGQDGSRQNLDQDNNLDLPAFYQLRSSWTMEDVYKTLGRDEIKNLLDAMIHNQHEDSEPEKIQHGCVGALKFTGDLHLWEQIHAGNWNGHMDELKADAENDIFVQKKRKKAYLKAKRQRLANKKVEPINKLSSKVSYTESSGQHFIELDLGECIINLQSRATDKKNKPISRKIAVKSLEISLSEKPR